MVLIEMLFPEHAKLYREEYVRIILEWNLHNVKFDSNILYNQKVRTSSVCGLDF